MQNNDRKNKPYGYSLAYQNMINLNRLKLPVLEIIKGLMFTHENTSMIIVTKT